MGEEGLTGMAILLGTILGKLLDPVLWALAAGSFFIVRSWWSIPIAAVLCGIAQVVVFKVLQPGLMPRGAGLAVIAAAVAGVIACGIFYGVRRLYRAGVDRDAID